MSQARTRAHQFLTPLVAQLLGGRAGEFSFRLYEGEGVARSGHGMVFMEPAVGEVIGVGPEFVAVRTAPTKFDVITTQFLGNPIAVGQRVKLRYYAMRRFDGAPVGITAELSGEAGLVSGHAPVVFPLRWDARSFDPELEPLSRHFPVARTPAMQILCRALEAQMCDALRNIPALLVDAGARAIRAIEIPVEMQFSRPAAGTGLARIEATVRTRRFTGTVVLAYDEPLNRFSLTLTPSTNLGGAKQWDDIRPEGIATALNQEVDDGAWRAVRVEVLEKAPASEDTAAKPTAAVPRAIGNRPRTSTHQHAAGRGTFPWWAAALCLAGAMLLAEWLGLWR